MTLIASVLHLSRADIKALKITDAYSLHRVIYSLYPDIRSETEKAASQSSGILFADQGGDFQHRKILLLANRFPADQLEGGYGEVQSRPIPDSFLSHQRYGFKVIINPTRRENNSRKLLPIKERDAIAQWFLERAKKNWGFEVNDKSFQIDKVQVLQFLDKNRQSITLAQAHVQGWLTVTNPEQFSRSFSQGIGRGRAFGCGLLQIVPLFDNPFA